MSLPLKYLGLLLRAPYKAKHIWDGVIEKIKCLILGFIGKIERWILGVLLYTLHVLGLHPFAPYLWHDITYIKKLFLCLIICLPTTSKQLLHDADAFDSLFSRIIFEGYLWTLQYWFLPCTLLLMLQSAALMSLGLLHEGSADPHAMQVLLVLFLSRCYANGLLMIYIYFLVTKPQLHSWTINCFNLVVEILRLSQCYLYLVLSSIWKQ